MSRHCHDLCGLAILSKRRMRHVYARWRRRARVLTRAVALDERAVTAAEKASVRTLRNSALRWARRVQRGRASAVLGARLGVLARGVRAAWARWTCARTRAWGRRQLHEIGEAAANLLAAQRSLGAWKAGAAKEAERRVVRAQVRAQVERMHEATARAAAHAAAVASARAAGRGYGEQRARRVSARGAVHYR